MLRVVLGVVSGLMVLAAASPGAAGDKLLRGPAPDWVTPAEVVTPKAAADGPAIRTLLYDTQARLGAEGDAEYFNVVAEVRTPMGLQRAGSFSIAWDPTLDTVTVHHLRIRRGRETIDVLARQDFTVIRRETNLERAMLDGILSATLQPEGLQAGDIVDMAYTRVHHDPVLQGRSDHLLRASPYGRTDRVRLRAVWDAGLNLAWKASDGLPKPKVSKAGRLTEVIVDLRDVESAKYPAGAPPRYFPRREIAISGFKTWDEVAAVMAPLFEKAAVLAPDSPLRAEVARIRAASTDPRVRAGLALQLVEDQVRYLALTMNNGGYVPQTPDDTWRRRFGDCKAKTVLLMALLRELGIEAEAAVVDSDGGDLLDLRPPAVSAFDHVIVRATIGGKVYWLDGTRMGDRNIDAVATPPFGQALPLRTTGSQLIALLQPPPTAPTSSTLLRIDARKGLDAPAPVHGEMTVSGPMANYFSMAAQNGTAADREKMLKSYWRAYSWIEPKTVSLVQEGATGTPGSSWTAPPRWSGCPRRRAAGSSSFRAES